MRNATPRCLDTFCRLDGLGLSVTAQRVEPGHTELRCCPTTPPSPCPGCAGPGVRHDAMLRRLAHVPYGWKPTILEVVVPRYRCRPCRRIWRHSIAAAAPSNEKLSRDTVILAVMSIARVAVDLGVAWNTASDAILAAGTELLIDSAGRLEGVPTVRVDEREWRHTRHGDKYVTVVIDLIPTTTKSGPSRLLAVVEGRSKQAFMSWLEAQTRAFRHRVETVAMDVFTGYRTVAVEAIDTVVTVMDPFHMVALVGDKLDQCRQRVQQSTVGHWGWPGDRLYGIRRILHTGAGLIASRQAARLEAVFACQAHLEVEIT